MKEESEASSRNLTRLAFDRLRSDILLGQLGPDSKLKVHAISERYGIGTTAIREALSRLVTDGLVAAEDQRGFTVASVSRAELMDLTETRIQIETLAITKSIQVGDLEWESSILAAFHSLSKTELPVTPDLHIPWERAHRRFHHALISGCRSSSLLRICAELYDKSERYRNLAERQTTPDKRDTIKEHRDLMDCVIRRDVAVASKLIANHLWTTTNIILESGFVKTRLI